MSRTRAPLRTLSFLDEVVPLAVDGVPLTELFEILCGIDYDPEHPLATPVERPGYLAALLGAPWRDDPLPRGTAPIALCSRDHGCGRMWTATLSRGLRTVRWTGFTGPDGPFEPAVEFAFARFDYEHVLVTELSLQRF
ncbi:hypothetical protein HQQ81_18230 [Microbacteriaceae bacterium VKM Ac-2854]|nr:hypothetical protein [Microbacteriaceae bacterium VKM Ac-2854]